MRYEYRILETGPTDKRLFRPQKAHRVNSLWTGEEETYWEPLTLYGSIEYHTLSDAKKAIEDFEKSLDEADKRAREYLETKKKDVIHKYP